MLSKGIIWASKVSFRKLMNRDHRLGGSQSADISVQYPLLQHQQSLAYLNKLAVVHADSQAPPRDLRRILRHLPTHSLSSCHHPLLQSLSVFALGPSLVVSSTLPSLKKPFSWNPICLSFFPSLKDDLYYCCVLPPLCCFHGACCPSA